MMDLHIKYKLIIFLVCLLYALSPSRARANGIFCEWFGVGCPEGTGNEALLDLGRSSTNQGFLFFKGDSAEIVKNIQFFFSEESVKKRDRLDLSFNDGLLPVGSLVYVDQVLLPGYGKATVIADKPEKNVVIRWVIPPTGKDVVIDGNIDVIPYGFERAGNMTLDSLRAVQPLPMLRIQGTVNNDWHWFKRLNFWFWLFVLIVLIFYRLVLSPVFLHQRFDLRGLRIMVFQEGKAMPVWEHDFRKIHGSIQALLGQKVPRQGLIARLMNGRIATATCPDLPSGLLIKIDKGKRKAIKGKKIQVRYGVGLVNSIYENETDDERTIHLPNSSLRLTFAIR
jgi:hypothetical protein